jgi:hypothetical protein
MDKYFAAIRNNGKLGGRKKPYFGLDWQDISSPAAIPTCWYTITRL